jgi:streptogramin lyase
MRHTRIITAAVAAATALALAPASAGALDLTLKEFTAGITAGAAPQDILVDADGRAWFTEPGRDMLGVANENGVTGERSIPAGVGGQAANPHSIARGFDLGLWFTEPGRDMIGRIDPQTDVVTEYPVAAGAAPLDIARGPDADMGLWFTEPGLRQIGRIAMDGTVTEYVSGGTGTPSQIAKGPDGMYFTMPDINAIGRMYTDSHIVTRVTTGISPGAAPLDIAEGANGKMWFTEPGTGSLGKVDSGGSVMTVTEQPLGFPLPGTPTRLGGSGQTPYISQGAGDLISQVQNDASVITLPISPSPGGTPTSIAPTSNPAKFWFTQPGRDGVAFVGPTPPPPPPPPPAPPAAPKPKPNPNLVLELDSEEASPVVVKAAPKNSAAKTGRRRVCYVPRLKLRTIAGARKLLKKNRCRVGKITRKGKSHKGLKLRVIKQTKRVHLRTTFNTKVSFSVAPRKAPKKAKHRK